MKIFKSVLFGYKTKRLENLKEAEILRKVAHINIINLIDVVDDANGVFLIMPLAKCSLHDEIYAENVIKLPARGKDVATMLLKAVGHIHQMTIMHRDLKPSNILVNMDGAIKICDFGAATEYEKDQYFITLCGTYPYTVPEILLKLGYNTSADIWDKFNH